MRKGLSILFVAVMLLSGAHVTIARHFCGGKVADTKVSLSGKLATCGMEESEESCPAHGTNIATHCCENQVNTIGFSFNYLPPIINEAENNLAPEHFSFLFAEFAFPEIINTYKSYTDSGPPGYYQASFAGLDKICVFRI